MKRNKRNKLDRIQIDPEVMLGKPVIRGTRIPVYLVLNLLAQGYTTGRILKAYPGLTKQDVEAALEFAARRFEKEETHLQHV